MGGASIDGVVDGGIDDVMGHAGAPLTLRIAWGGLELDIAARIVSGETAGEFPVTHLRFEHLTAAQELEIAALVGAKAAAFKEGQRGLLQYLASADS